MPSRARGCSSLALRSDDSVVAGSGDLEIQRSASFRSSLLARGALGAYSHTVVRRPGWIFTHADTTQSIIWSSCLAHRMDPTAITCMKLPHEQRGDQRGGAGALHRPLRRRQAAWASMWTFERADGSKLTDVRWPGARVGPREAQRAVRRARVSVIERQGEPSCPTEPNAAFLGCRGR